MCIAALMLGMARAASSVGTATRTISQPACSRRCICRTVAFTSSVGVLHMDCMLTAAPPPTGTAPTCMRLVTVPASSVDQLSHVAEHQHHHQRQQQNKSREVDIVLIFCRYLLPEQQHGCRVDDQEEYPPAV